MLSLFVLAGAFAGSVLSRDVSTTVSAYISTESPIARAGLLNNIGPHGVKAPGAFPGVVVASPSTENPNYFYSWVRDSALVFKTLIDDYTTGKNTSKELHTLIDYYVTATSVYQHIANPSGNITTGGIGEPKFYVNETAFWGSWGRPQRDGPALRSTALITYANYLYSKGNTTFVKNTLWPIIELDVNYVASYWNYTTFDLWEEVASSSFFTTAVQYRSLRMASALAKTLHSTDNVKFWDTQAGNVLCFLQSYWNASGGYALANTGGGRSGIDANTVLTSIHMFDSAAGCDATTFQPCSDRALSNLKVYVDSFRTIYAINSGAATNFSQAVATGRYQEDVYMGGNPWYLCTAAAAEQLYDALYVWAKQGKIEVTAVSLAFFRQFDASIRTGTVTDIARLTAKIRAQADGFLAIHAQYTPKDGGLAEQFDRATGAVTSAVDLTWSYAAALTAFAARLQKDDVVWGAKGAAVPSGECQSNIGGVDGKGIPVTFVVNAETDPGQAVYVTGGDVQLQSWSPTDALAMADDNSTWTVTVNLPAAESVEYKYIKKDSSGNVVWESDPNNSLTVPETGTLKTDDTWR